MLVWVDACLSGEAGSAACGGGAEEWVVGCGGLGVGGRLLGLEILLGLGLTLVLRLEVCGLLGLGHGGVWV